jgi:glycosyltransferase involved in cell wall biosynthesis
MHSHVETGARFALVCARGSGQEAAVKVAFLLPWYVDAGPPDEEVRYLLNLACGLAEAEASCRVAVVAFGSRPRQERLETDVSLQVLAAPFRPEQPRDLLAWELPQALRDADLVHVHQPGSQTGQAGLLLARLAHKPVCVTDHDSAGTDLGAALRLLTLAQGLVCPSEFIRSLAPAGVATAVVPPGVDLEYWRPPEEGASRDRLVCLAPLLLEKGIERAIEALPEGARLNVCGPPADADYARQLRRLARGKAVEFVADGGDEQRRRLLQKACAVVLPAVHRDWRGAGHPVPEWTGLALLEALACGTPVLASRVAGLPELVEHGQTGFLFDDVAGLREQVRHLMDDPGEVTRLGANGRQHVERHHDRRRIGGRLGEVYRRLLKEGRKSA